MYAPVIALAAGGIILLLLAGMDFDPLPRKGILAVLLLTGVVGGLVVLGNLLLLLGLLAAALALGAVGGFVVNGAQVEQLRFKLEQERLSRSQLKSELARIQDRQERLVKELSSHFVQSGRQVAAELAKMQSGEAGTERSVSPTEVWDHYLVTPD